MVKFHWREDNMAWFVLAWLSICKMLSKLQTCWHTALSSVGWQHFSKESHLPFSVRFIQTCLLNLLFTDTLSHLTSRHWHTPKDFQIVFCNQFHTDVFAKECRLPTFMLITSMLDTKFVSKYCQGSSPGMTIIRTLAVGLLCNSASQSTARLTFYQDSLVTHIS